MGDDATGERRRGPSSEWTVERMTESERRKPGRPKGNGPVRETVVALKGAPEEFVRDSKQPEQAMIVIKNFCWILLLACLPAVLTGCSTLSFHERAAFGRPVVVPRRA